MVLAAPVAVGDSFGTMQDTPLVIEGAALVANDTDSDGDTLTPALAVGSGPWHGTLTIQDDDTLVYKPAPGFYGDDFFRYFVADGTSFSQRSTEVHIDVIRLVTPGGGFGGTFVLNPTPGIFGVIVIGEDFYETPEDVPKVVSAPGVLRNDPIGNSPVVELQVQSLPSHGTVSLALDGSFTYTPAQDYYGSDDFWYQWTNGEGTSQSAKVHITVTPVNDAPVVIDDNLTAESGIPLKISVGDLQANDYDVDNAVVTVIVPLRSAPQHGALAFAEAGLLYTPDAGYVGSDHFAYVATDGEAFSAGAAIASIELSPPVRRNSVLPGDVDFDGQVAPGDALAIINYLNAYGSKSVSLAALNSHELLDVNGDGSVAASDALAVINELNARSPAPARVPERFVDSAAAVDAAIAESVAGFLSSSHSAMHRRPNRGQSASRWKSIDVVPSHIPGLPSSQPASNSLSASSSVSSGESFRTTVMSYFMRR